MREYCFYGTKAHVLVDLRKAIVPHPSLESLKKNLRNEVTYCVLAVNFCNFCQIFLLRDVKTEKPTRLCCFNDGSPTILTCKPLPRTGVYSWTAWCSVGGERRNFDGQVGVGPHSSEYTVLQDNGFLLGPKLPLLRDLRGYVTEERVTVTVDMDRRLAHFFVEREYVISARLLHDPVDPLYFMIWVRTGEGDEMYEAHCEHELSPPPLPAVLSVRGVYCTRTDSAGLEPVGRCRAIARVARVCLLEFI